MELTFILTLTTRDKRINFIESGTIRFTNSSESLPGLEPGEHRYYTFVRLTDRWICLGPGILVDKHII